MSWITKKLNDVADKFLDNATDKIKKKFVDFLDDLEEKANETPNPVDNWLVDILRDVFKIKKGATNGSGKGKAKK